MAINEFKEYVNDLLQDKQLINRIIDYPAHRFSDHTSKYGTGRLAHCLRVSFLCYKLANVLKLNRKACARAGFLHDIGYGTDESPGMQVIMHSFYSAEIARNRNEMDVAEIIESHMFPLGRVPKSREAFILWIVDKIDAIFDFFHITLSSDFFELNLTSC